MLTCREKVGGSQRTPLLTKRKRGTMFITKFGIIFVGVIVALVLFWRHIFILTLFILSILFILEINYGGFTGFMTSWVK